MSQTAQTRERRPPPQAKDAVFNWEDPLDLESELTEEERMVRDTARGSEPGGVAQETPARRPRQSLEQALAALMRERSGLPVLEPETRRVVGWLTNMDVLRAYNQRLEADVLASIEVSEPRAGRIKELTALIAEKEKELVAAEKEIASQVEELKTTIRKQRVERDKVATGVEDALLQRYEMIFSRRAGLAVAQAKSGTCQGCRMRLPPQLYNEIQKHLEIMYFPGCQLILYYEG